MLMVRTLKVSWDRNGKLLHEEILPDSQEQVLDYKNLVMVFAEIYINDFLKGIPKEEIQRTKQ
jgi:hypothetical protein